MCSLTVKVQEYRSLRTTAISDLFLRQEKEFHAETSRLHWSGSRSFKQKFQLDTRRYMSGEVDSALVSQLIFVTKLDFPRNIYK